MRVERSYLIRVVQVYEGDDMPDTGWPIAPWLDSEQDEFVCGNWNLISDEIELLDNDQWEARIIQGVEK